jgi:adenine deaminase
MVRTGCNNDSHLLMIQEVPLSLASLLNRRIHMAMGREPVDLVIENVRVVNVFSGSVMETCVAIGDGHIVALGDRRACQRINAQGRYMIPGLIDAHVHIESSMMTPQHFAATILPHGTTTIVADPHEIANVLGAGGIRYMLDATRDIPLDVRIMLPSCVPATPFEHSGAELTAKDLAPLMNLDGVLGLGEVMNFPGVTSAHPDVMEKILLARAHGCVADGHSPGVTGPELQAYAGAGITTDHECSTLAEMHERIENGMYVLMREGSASRNLTTLIPGITPSNMHRCAMCSDDRDPVDLLAKGHMDHNLRLAVQAGLDPIVAVTMATLNAAQCYGMTSKGAIAPGYQADVLLVDDLTHFNVHQVFVAGKEVAREGRLVSPLASICTESVAHTVHMAPLAEDSLTLRLDHPKGRVIGIIPQSIVTNALERHLVLDHEGCFHPAANPGLSKLAVIERHHATGNMGLGIIEGYGITSGAIATTVAHDSHNVIVAGDNDQDMLLAVRHLQTLGGGIAMVHDGRIIGDLPLPIAGLMSDRPGHEVARNLENLLALAHETLQVSKQVHPFMSLSFLALPVIPQLKLTDKGLFDVQTFSFTRVEAENNS